VKKNSPIKRNENLAIFSREHHHGLVFCSRLKKAKQACDSVLKLFINEFWENYLESHFNNEEQLLLPLLNDKKLITQFLDQHNQIRQLIDCIRTSTNNIQNNSLELAQQINNHIRFEERVLFPWLEKTVSKEELDRIGKCLGDNEIGAHYFKPEFWKKVI
jgi:hemerythrin-like domain-containing protein